MSIVFVRSNSVGGLLGVRKIKVINELWHKWRYTTRVLSFIFLVPLEPISTVFLIVTEVPDFSSKSTTFKSHTCKTVKVDLTPGRPYHRLSVWTCSPDTSFRLQDRDPNGRTWSTVRPGQGHKLEHMFPLKRIKCKRPLKLMEQKNGREKTMKTLVDTLDVTFTDIPHKS